MHSRLANSLSHCVFQSHYDKQEVVWQISPLLSAHIGCCRNRQMNWFLTVKPAAGSKAKIFCVTAGEFSATFVMTSGFLPLHLAEKCQWGVSPSSLSSCPELPGASLPPAPPASLGLYLKNMEIGTKQF